jgi:DTW domain-containing protein YfiP
LIMANPTVSVERQATSRYRIKRTAQPVSMC